MTLPNLPFNSTTQDDLAENVVMPADLGTALQDHSTARYAAQTGSRYPAAVDGTLAGSPIGTGVLGIVNKMAAKLTSQVANSDPADIRKANDLQALIPGFFDLPLQDMFAPLLNALSGVGGGVLGGSLSGIADLFSSKWDLVDYLEDGQNSLRDRLDLVEDVSGYVSLWQNAAAISSTGGTSSTPRFLPWNDVPVGPEKNAHRGTWSHPSRGTISGIWFDAWGTWELDVQVVHSTIVVFGSPSLAVGVDVYDTHTGSLYTRKIATGPLSNNASSWQLSHRVVIAEGRRYFAATPVWHNLSGGAIDFPGTDTYSTFAAKRIDIRTDGEQNPPPTIGDV